MEPQSLRSQLDKLKVEREQLRREQEDLLALPRSHPEILADIDQALLSRAGRDRHDGANPWRG